MASNTKASGVGVVVHESYIRGVTVRVDASDAAVKRYASTPRNKSDLAGSIMRVIDALDPKKTLPIGVTCEPLPDADQLTLLSAIGPARTVKLHRPAHAVAQLNLAPGTRLSSVDQLEGCSIPAKLLKAHPDLRVADLLGAIGAVLATVERPTAAAGTTAPAKSVSQRKRLSDPTVPASARAGVAPTPPQRARPTAAAAAAEPKQVATVADNRLAPPQIAAKREQSFTPPLVRLADNNSVHQASTRSRKRGRLAGRRPLPLAVAALIVLIGLGIALGVVLSGADPALEEQALGLVLHRLLA